jgi:hypothetical protein
MHSRIREKIGSSMMTTSEATRVGTELDTDHAPETNGRMSVCRRCGVQTDSPLGTHHVLNERQLSRSQDWLRLQAQQRRIDRVRELQRN